MNNTGEIVAWLRVANVDAVNSFLTQILELGNKDGGDIKVYTRRYNGSSWSAWQILQPMTEVGQVDSLNGFIDNGMYSGALTNGDTFAIIVINNYAVAASAGQERSISQFKYSLALSGGVQFQHRTGKGAAAIAWSEWQNVGEERLPIVDESQLDNIGGDMTQFLDAITNLGTRYYTVTSTARKIVVGKMEIISDNNMHGVTQILKTHYLLNEDGTLNLLAHTHNELYIYTRTWDRNSKSWSKWVEYKEDIRKSIQEINEFLSSDFLEQTYAYGVEWDTAVTTPECTRIGSMNLHRSLPVQSRMRGCLLNDNGVVVEYLPANDWTTAVRDGSKGQVMVELPKHYRKFVTDGTKRQVWLSMMPLAGYHEVPKAYVGAYEASLDRTNLKLASVANTSEQYRGGDNTEDWDGTYRSLLGRPATRLNFYNCRDYARKRNTNTKEWNMYVYNVHKTICWLFIVEYATRDSQTTFSSALTAGGYKQGGLGMGATLMHYSKYPAFNNSNPFVPCGYTDSLGNNTGVLQYTMPTEYDTVTTQVEVNRYRGIELPFGHISEIVDGILLDSTADIQKAYVCENPELYALTTENYRYAGEVPRPTESYIRDILFGEHGDIVPSMVNDGADAHKHYCDVFWSDTYKNIRSFIVGGCGNDSYRAGLFAIYAKYDFGVVSNGRGTRLCFIPTKK